MTTHAPTWSSYRSRGSLNVAYHDEVVPTAVGRGCIERRPEILAWAGDQGPGAMRSFLAGRPGLGMLLTCVSAVACTVSGPLIGLKRCAEVPECTEAAAKDKISIDGYVAVGIAALLLKEAGTLAYTRLDQQMFREYSLPETMQCSVILCSVLSVLTIAQILFANGYSLAYAVPPLMSFAGEWGPVHTLRFVAWALDVPMLLVLSGHFILGRPLAETTTPIAVTNMYLYLSWVAVVVSSAPLRWLLIVVSFAGYGWASFGMIGWVRRFLAEAPLTLPARWTRVALIVSLITLFGIYGLIYLAAAFGAISFARGHILYGIFDGISKAGMCIFMTFIRMADRSKSIKTMMVHHSFLVNAFLSLLRSSFDHVLVCDVSEFGDCRVSKLGDCDRKAMESLTGFAVEGRSFNDLLATTADRDRFKEYLQNVLDKSREEESRRQQESQQGFPELAMMWTHSNRQVHSPQMAEMLHCNLTCAGRAEDTDAISSIRVCIHLSVATSERSPSTDLQVVIAISPLQENTNRLSEENTRIPMPAHDYVFSFAPASVSSSNASCMGQPLQRVSAVGPEQIDGCTLGMQRPRSFCTKSSVKSSVDRTETSFAISASTATTWQDCSVQTTDLPQHVDCASQTMSLPPLPQGMDSLRGFTGRSRNRRPSRKCSKESSGSQSPAAEAADFSVSDEEDCSLTDLNGQWVLVQAPGDIHRWLYSLGIEGSNVIDGIGGVTTLTKGKGGTVMLEGGILSREGDTLCRIGKSGVKIQYRRAHTDSSAEVGGCSESTSFAQSVKKTPE